jgi:hypothetical protein
MSKPDVGGPTPDDSDLETEYQREIHLIQSLAAGPVELNDAPDDLWQRIEAAAATSDPRRPANASASRTGNGFVSPQTDSAVTTSARSQTPTRRAQRSRRWTLVAAVVLAALLIGVGVIMATRNSGPTELAAAVLSPYEAAPVGKAGGRVQLLRNGDRLRLRVNMHDLPAPAPGTFYELWLLDAQAGEPVSLATMTDGSSDVSTDLDVPSGTDPKRFAVVDVSVQEASAGPSHSGHSVLRGTLSS